jgi:hypothetical protein
MSTCTRPKPSDYDEAGRDIENTLASIKSIAGTIDGLDDAQLKPGVLSYLADRLVEHYDEIYDAYSRIFGYGEYAENKPGESEAGVSSGEPVGEAELRARAAVEQVNEGGVYRAALAEIKSMRGDADLFALERRIHETRAKGNAEGISDEEEERLSLRDASLRVRLNKMQPTTMAGVVAKLRELAHPDHGIEQGDIDGDFESLRQILAFLEQGARP